MATNPWAAHPLVRNLENVAPLTDASKKALAELAMQVVHVEADREVLREGDRATQCCVVLEGFMINYKVTKKGERQILAYHLPGDIPDLQSLHLAVLDSSLGTVTPCKLGFVPHKDLWEICAREPDVGRACWRWTLIMASIYREWVTNVGQREAPARIGHLLCEIVVRMETMGLAEGRNCPLPLTQTELADATGMSTVHVNRTLQELRNAGIISWKDKTLSILDWGRLKRIGEFDPGYLHLREREEVA